MSGKYDLGGLSLEFKRSDSIWQFSEMLPPVSKQNIVSMGEGWTACIPAKRFGSGVGLPNLWCKLEGMNPSGSFKDRLASLGISLAQEWRKDGVFTSSSGNAAAAVSAYASRAGIPCVILVKDNASPSKIFQIAMYGGKIVRMRDIFIDERSLFSSMDIVHEALPNWFNHLAWAPVNPLLQDSLKTLSYELYVQWVPDYIFVPTAGGDLLCGIFKGFSELHEMGLVEKVPKMVVVQGFGASPTVDALESGKDVVSEIVARETVANALSVTFGSEETIQVVRKSGGFGVSVNDDEIIAAQRNVMRSDGIFTEVSSASALAAVSKAARMNKVTRDDKVLAVLTGNGFKDYYPETNDVSTFPIATEKTLPSILKSITS